MKASQHATVSLKTVVLAAIDSLSLLLLLFGGKLVVEAIHGQATSEAVASANRLAGRLVDATHNRKRSIDDVIDADD